MNQRAGPDKTMGPRPLTKAATPKAKSLNSLDCNPRTQDVQPNAEAIQAAIRRFRVSDDQITELRAPRVPARNGFRTTA